MDKGFFYLTEALSIMRRVDKMKEPIPFKVAVRTFNRQSKRGGKFIEYKKAVLLPLSGKEKPLSKEIEHLAFLSGVKRNPNHFENKTRNIKLPNGSVKTINLNYLITLNGTSVIY